uniref:Uncharacterized protein n=1 Tax=Opuntia streptacantha TaxID=393608 RepID=A0A7C8ZC82_OPUST
MVEDTSFCILLATNKNVQPSSKVNHKDWVVLLENKAKVQNEQAKNRKHQKNGQSSHYHILHLGCKREMAAIRNTVEIKTTILSSLVKQEHLCKQLLGQH